MTDKEKMKYYVELLGDWQKGLDSFFTHECPDAPPGAVNALLEGHNLVVQSIAGIIDNLPDAQDNQ